MPITPANLFALTNSFSSTVADLQRLGISVEIGDDFTAYRKNRSRIAGRGQIYPMFDVGGSYIDHSNGFWMCGYDQDGEIVHTQAVRLLDLTDCDLASHLARHRHKYVTPNSTIDPDQTYFIGPRALQKITGPVCYHGEFWLRAQGLGGPRSLGATPLLSKLLLQIAVAAWEPAFLFGLVPKKLASKGAHLRYGYVHCEPGQWVGPNQEVTDEDYLIWMDVDELSGQQQPTLISPSRSGGIPNSNPIRDGRSLGPQLVLAGE